MAWTTPTTRATGDLITASIWNTDLINNLSFLHTSLPAFGAAGNYLTNPYIAAYSDAQTLGAGSSNTSVGPLFTFPTAAWGIVGASTAWFTSSAHTTLANPAGAWAWYFISGTGVYADYFNPTGANLFLVGTVGAIGY